MTIAAGFNPKNINVLSFRGTRNLRASKHKSECTSKKISTKVEMTIAAGFNLKNIYVLSS